MRAWAILAGSAALVALGAAPAAHAGFAHGPGSPYTAQVDGANSIAVADLNRDGILDIATPGSGNAGTQARLATFLGNGSGGFTKPAGNPFVFGTFSGANSIVLRDLTADGVPDSIVSHDRGGDVDVAATGRVTVRVSDGAGGIALTGPDITTFGDRTVDVAVEDVRGSALPDLVSVDLRGQANDADPSYYIRTGVNTTPLFGAAVANPIAFANDHVPAAITLADLDGDGLEEMAATVGDGRIVTLKGTTELATFETAVVRRTGSGTLTRILAVDVDGDGDRDLVTAVTAATPQLVVTRNNGQGGFTEVPGSPSNISGATNARGVAAGDLTGDGRLDVAIAHPGNRRVSVLAGNGAGGFAPMAGSPFSTEPVEQPAGIAIGDFDRDFHPDLAISHNENAARMSVLINDGRGRATFAGTDFGTGPVTPRVRTVTVSNPGTGVLRMNGVGKPGDGYEVAADRCTGRTVVVGGACGIDVRFTGTSPRRATSPLTVATQDGSFATTLNAVTRAPLLTRVGLSRKRFLVGKGRGRGTRVRFTLSEAVGVRIGFERAAAGRRSKGKCRKPTRRLVRARAKRCTRYVATKLVIRRNGKAGANSVAFTGKVGKRRLRPGAHRVVVVARDARKNASRVARVGFRVRKPAAKRAVH